MHLKNNMEKAIRFFKRNGFRATIERIGAVLKERKNKSYQKWMCVVQPTAAELDRQRTVKFPRMPLLSVIVPTYNTPALYLKEFLDSMQKQTYSNWELCIAEGCSTKKDMLETLKGYEQADPRIRVKYLTENKGISGNTNEAIAIAQGEYIALADHDDMLTPDALFEVVKVINEQNADLLYSDEDKMDESSTYFYEPHFKPDFSPDKLRCCNYFCHLMVMSKQLLMQTGLLDSKFDGSQDHDLALRLSEHAKKIVHIPKVLYHWRQFANSMSKQHLERCQKAGREAVAAHLKRIALPAVVEQDHGYRVRYEISGKALVSIVLLEKADPPGIASCIKKIQRITSYPQVEIIVVRDTFGKTAVPEQSRISVKEVEGDEKKGAYYNRNLGAAQANGEYLLFLDSDLEIAFPDWLEQLVAHAQRKEIGAVGSKLYDKDKHTIQSAGYILGKGRQPFFAYQGASRYAVGYCGLERCDRNVSAVPAALLMVRKSAFEEVNGFAEGFSQQYGDVDFCLRLLCAGYLNMYTPYAEASYRTNRGRQIKTDAADKLLFDKIWQENICDGYYNANLTQTAGDYSLNMDLYKERQQLRKGEE